MLPSLVLISIFPLIHKHLKFQHKVYKIKQIQLHIHLFTHSKENVNMVNITVSYSSLTGALAPISE